MTSSYERRVNIARCWASSRIAVMDCLEKYEDSYAITQEFREWITSIAEHPEHLADSLLMVPQHFQGLSIKEANDIDEMLEI